MRAPDPEPRAKRNDCKRKNDGEKDAWFHLEMAPHFARRIQSILVSPEERLLGGLHEIHVRARETTQIREDVRHCHSRVDTEPFRKSR